MENDKTILIVEDDADIREAMQEAIEDAGYVVYTAVNGEEGLNLALDKKPDLILLDIMMPVMNGHEMLKKLREDNWGKHAKVMILSAMDDVGNITTAYKGDIVGYIIKGHTSVNETLRKVRIALFTDNP